MVLCLMILFVSCYSIIIDFVPNNIYESIFLSKDINLVCIVYYG